MSVPESQRGESKFEVLIRARELACYTIKICTNQNVFLPQYQNAATDKIIATATDIFIKCFTANNILVKEKDQYIERKRLQDSACDDCNNLLALMQIAQQIFHLSTKRIKYWGELSITTRNLIRKWKESDYKRFNNLE